MTYKAFKEIIELQIAHHRRVGIFYDLRLDIIEVFSEQEKAMELLWQVILTEYGYDWLCWYLYEKDGISGKPRKGLKAWDDEKKEICKDLKSLWKYLTKEKYFR